MQLNPVEIVVFTLPTATEASKPTANTKHKIFFFITIPFLCLIFTTDKQLAQYDKFVMIFSNYNTTTASTYCIII